MKIRQIVKKTKKPKKTKIKKLYNSTNNYMHKMKKRSANNLYSAIKNHLKSKYYRQLLNKSNRYNNSKLTKKNNISHIFRNKNF